MTGTGLPVEASRRRVLNTVHEDFQAIHMGGDGEVFGLNAVHVLDRVDVTQRKRLPLPNRNAWGDGLNARTAPCLRIRIFSVVHDRCEVLRAEVLFVLDVTFEIPQASAGDVPV